MKKRLVKNFKEKWNDESGEVKRKALAFMEKRKAQNAEMIEIESGWGTTYRVEYDRAQNKQRQCIDCGKVMQAAKNRTVKRCEKCDLIHTGYATRKRQWSAWGRDLYIRYIVNCYPRMPEDAALVKRWGARTDDLWLQGASKAEKELGLDSTLTDSVLVGNLKPLSEYRNDR